MNLFNECIFYTKKYFFLLEAYFLNKKSKATKINNYENINYLN